MALSDGVIKVINKRHVVLGLDFCRENPPWGGIFLWDEYSRGNVIFSELLYNFF